MKPAPAPKIIALAGPNGAGKSTAGPALSRDTLGVTEFVNADVIAHGLSAFAPEQAAIAAGRVMLDRIKGLARARKSFAFETTLASRSFAPWITGLRARGWHFHLLYLWISRVDLAVARVAGRVRLGGHHVPEDVVRRRYRAGLQNFFGLYLPLANSWEIYDNSGEGGPILVARCGGDATPEVTDSVTWRKIRAGGEST